MMACVSRKNVNDEYELAVKDIKLWEVIGVDDLAGLTFAFCSTEDKAKRAKELVDENLGVPEMVAIRQSQLTLDVININDIEFML